MAARIAELLTREQQVKSTKAKEACRKECSELICRLKSLREEQDPQSIWNNINRNLGVLVDAGNHNYWFPKRKKAELLDVRCDLNNLSYDKLVERLIALNNKQRKILLLLGTDDLLESNGPPDAINQDLLDRLLNMRKQILDDNLTEKGWRDKLQAAKTRNERLAVLCRQMRSVGRETQRVVKESHVRDITR